MRLAAALLLLATALAEDGGDPDGTLALRLEPGGLAPLEAAPGANVICDDPTVVAPDFDADGGDGFVLRALKPGSTLCGLWLVGQKPGGLYRVQVLARSVAERSASDGGRTDSGAPDAGSDGGSAGAGGADASAG